MEGVLVSRKCWDVIAVACVICFDIEENKIPAVTSRMKDGV
jgi:hypothetical protein